MGAAKVEPAPLRVAFTLAPELDDELDESELLLLPQAATPTTSVAATGTTASHWRDVTAAPSFACVVGARLAALAGQSVTDVWQGCGKDVDGRSHRGHGVSTGARGACATMPT